MVTYSGQQEHGFWNDTMLYFKFKMNMHMYVDLVFSLTSGTGSDVPQAFAFLQLQPCFII